MANDEQQPDTSEPSDERKAELEAAYERQKDTDAPYKGIQIRTLGELEWVMEQRKWSGKYEGDFRTGLRNGYQRANLSGANLSDIQLLNANLVGANLSGTNLLRANLSHADLSDAIFDNKTTLDNVIFSTHSKLGDIRWNRVPLLRIDWHFLLKNGTLQLGDEDLISLATTQQKHLEILRYVIRAYRGLARELNDQNLAEFASAARLRERRLNRRAMFLRHRPESIISGIGSWVLDLVSGYGEKPGRIFISYLVVVLTFAAAYFGVTHLVETGLSYLSWDEALVLSLTSFHGRGFFPGYLQLNDWVARIAAVEAVIGLFIELILIATFSRRFLGD